MQSTTKKFDLDAIGEKITGFFAKTVDAVARQTKFVQRCSPLSGLIFLKAMVFGYLEAPHASLSDLVKVCLDLEVSITPQGLDERINPFSVAFLKAMFIQAFEIFRNQVPLPLPVLEQFSAINLVDSSVKELPDSMVGEYPGCGGDGAQASLKIQLVFDFLRGNLTQITLQAGRTADQSYRDYLAVVERGSLTITDLGYFCLDALRTIAEKGAYFLIRYLYPTALLTPQGGRIDLLALLRSETTDHIDQPVLLGSQPQHRITCRMIALRMPQAVAEERRRKAIAHAAKRGRGETLSQDYLYLLGWALFLTNASTNMLSVTQVACLYRVRWQIELIFKLWKSYCGLNAIGLWRRDRTLTELYAKMIGIVLIHFILAPLRIPDEVWSGREISAVQVRKLLARFAVRLNLGLTDEAAFIKVLRQLFDQIERFGFKQKRRKKPNVCQRLASALA
jgi:hypothetical protein